MILHLDDAAAVSADQELRCMRVTVTVRISGASSDTANESR
jgi:hypothetical protein